MVQLGLGIKGRKALNFARWIVVVLIGGDRKRVLELFDLLAICVGSPRSHNDPRCVGLHPFGP